MQRTKNVLFNITLAFICLLIFLLVFEQRLVLPAWLQVTGRMHPLFLHFPVVLVILYAVVGLIRFKDKETENNFRNIADLLLLFAALSAVVTALMGLFLSRESGYDQEALLWHKWSGVAVAVFAFGWYYFRRTFQQNRVVGLGGSLVAVALIIIAGHQGAGITHGQNFLLAPLLPEKKDVKVAFEEAVVYTHLVKPILEGKCYSCHNEKKAKGELIMETEFLLVKGGKSGVLWDTTAADLGLLLRRVHLPIEEKKHMPPQGKPQLTDEEIMIITQWIRKGADFKLRATELDPADTLRQLAQAKFSATELAAYDFEAADQSTVRKLNTVNRIVTEEALSSPALTVNFFNSQLFKPEQLKELSPVKKQIVSLDLAKMNVTDADLKTISDFENLRQLNLSFTGITGSTIQELKKLKFLKTLSVSGTKISAQALQQLAEFPQLRTVYAWNTGIDDATMKQVATKASQIRFENGFSGDTMRLKLSSPVLQNEEVVLNEAVPLKLKHYINGAEIRFTLDGSAPDSLKSPLYTGKETVDGNVLLRAKAYKAGWESSDELEASFYKNTYTADSVIYTIPPDPSYVGDSKLLINQLKGEISFRNGGWMAWRRTNMDVLMLYSKPVPVSSVTLSSLTDINSYIMPPAKIEVWGGDDPKHLRLLGTITPEQPSKLAAPSMRGYECKFEKANIQVLRIVAKPVMSLPSWHPGKGDFGWVFCDEILVN